MRFLLVLVSILLLLYISFPNLSFPKPLSDSVQSGEMADTETPYRRAYFTNFSREEVISHYQREFSKIGFGIQLPSLRLNYPPEDSQILIRDQTRSTFLEEIVHPFRESLFVNGFKPKFAKDDISYKGVHYEQKITVKYVPSSPYIRLLVFVGILIMGKFVVQELIDSIKTNA